MKRILLFIVLILLSTSSFSQVSYGRFVMFPDAKLTGSMWKPQIAFVRIDSLDVICVRSIASDTYWDFDSESRVLIRFSDSTTFKLPIVPQFDIQKDYQVDFIGSTLLEQYITYSFYEIDEEVVAKIIYGRTPIVKIRLAYSNGTVRDYDIGKKYQEKLILGLIESHQIALQTNAIRKENMTDEDF